ncbi:MAG: HAD hydrolase-like protein [Ignavibacteria bacterium]|nr:HAD hydrolase-like protein [Ignavibacteria bacterium]
MKNVLLLFDIDGTILRVEDGVSRSVFQNVFRSFFGVKEKPLEIDFDFAGLTDLDIVFRIAKIYGIDIQLVTSNINSLWERLLEEFFIHCKREQIHLIDYAYEFIEILSKKDQVCLGLLTGNFKDCAYFKLKLVGLDKYFPFGAFGDESVERSNLHKAAIKRANEYFNKEMFTQENTFVIGDSIPDVVSAKVNNIKVIAVSTGRTNYNELAKYEPDLLVHNFAEKEKIFEFVGL